MFETRSQDNICGCHTLPSCNLLGFSGPLFIFNPFLVIFSPVFSRQQHYLTGISCQESVQSMLSHAILKNLYFACKISVCLSLSSFPWVIHSWAVCPAHISCYLLAVTLCYANTVSPVSFFLFAVCQVHPPHCHCYLLNVRFMTTHSHHNNNHECLFTIFEASLTRIARYLWH